MIRLGPLGGPKSEAARAYDDATRSSASTPWAEASYVVVDLETNGLNPKVDEIIAYASIPIDSARVVVGGARTAIIRPELMPMPDTMRIHGLRPADLEDAPPLSDALDLILDSLAGRVLVAHAAWVERGFLGAALKTQGVKLAEPVLDTASLAAQALGFEDREGATLALGEVARQLGLPVHSPHVAEGDALTTAQVFLALAARRDREESQTVGSLARLSG